MSSRKKALEAFKRSKDQRSQGLSLINECEVRETENIYDEMAEDLFAQEQTDAHYFVVDDGAFFFSS